MAQTTSTPEQVSNLLKSEHHQIEEMITKVKDNSGAARDSAFIALSRLLVVHEGAEEHKELPDLAKDASPEELRGMYDAGQRVPELADPQGGPIEADADFASRLASAEAEFSKLSGQLG